MAYGQRSMASGQNCRKYRSEGARTEDKGSGKTIQNVVAFVNSCAIVFW